MSRPRGIPTYRKHKASGQAIVTLTDPSGQRHDVLLGQYGSADSRREYARVLGEWEANGRRLPAKNDALDGLSINELIVAYWAHVETYYRHADGTPTSEVDAIRLALRRLKNLYGHTLAASFDTLALEALRRRMIDDGLCRNRINKDIARVKRLFKWAGARQLIAPEVFLRLQTVEGLRAGRTNARETEPVKPVAEEWVRATLPFLGARIAAMVELQWLTGMRPGEVAIMRTMDLETTGKVWLYRPATHKTAHRGQSRTILIGPKGQQVLRPWLRLALTEYLFQPREERAEFDAGRRSKRRSKVTPSQAARRPKRKPQRQPGDHYPVSSYDNSIAKGIAKANAARACPACRNRVAEERCSMCRAAAIPHWHPHQLRHAKATEIRREAGLDAARAVLGHRTSAVTEVYAELDAAKAASVMERLG